jgi:flagellar hook-associated protein 3 FlgL
MRVSENSTTSAIKNALNRNKEKMENLQLKGATLKDIRKPSDNPTANIESLVLKTRMKNNDQFFRNSNIAGMNLSATEQSLSQLIDIVNQAKETAITQSSDFYDENTRKNIAAEVIQLKNQALAIANKRVGQKYIFAGFKSLSAPFDNDGNYKGDKGQVKLEVKKDFFVPINLNGVEVFYESSPPRSLEEKLTPANKEMQIQELSPQEEDQKNIPKQMLRDLASIENRADSYRERENLFALLDTLTSALENNDSKLIQSLLPRLDKTHARLITLQTRLGSLSNSVEKAKNSIEQENVDYADVQSQLTDADITELFSDIVKQQNILKTSYQAAQGTMNKTLLDFIR